MNLIKQTPADNKANQRDNVDISFIATQFNSEGLLEQLSFAEKAIEKGENFLAMRGKCSVVFIAEKQKNPLYEEKALRRLFANNDYIGYGYMGLLADGVHISHKMLLQSQLHWKNFNEPIQFHSLVDVTSRYLHIYTHNTRARPMGCSIVLATYTALEGPQLFQIHPSGEYYGYFACAGGRDMKSIKKILTKNKNAMSKMSAKSLILFGKKILTTLKKKGETQKYTLDVGVIGQETENKMEINAKRWIKILNVRGSCSSFSSGDTNEEEADEEGFSEDDDDDIFDDTESSDEQSIDCEVRVEEEEEDEEEEEEEEGEEEKARDTVMNTDINKGLN